MTATHTPAPSPGGEPVVSLRLYVTDHSPASQRAVDSVRRMVRDLPEPIRRVIGDLCDQGEILLELLTIPQDVTR